MTKKIGGLVVGRNPGESIIIGDIIKVTLVKEEDDGLLRVRIEAPKEIGIFREELYNEATSTAEGLYKFAHAHKKEMERRGGFATP